ncbi:hypothetical protein Vadar_003032 [Vaccinium darrowii]|uniref:Uncharacterized protein n=1 Tax=Vaccinium darrowii TaxID=229202 RepID=A0ACB7YJD3_9ERIC|nr:hypothetical protein Vadar_003032 [Vaccinium darrowii]
MRVADAKVETKTEHSEPVLLTQLRSLEKHASEVYTQYMFKLFQEEIVREGSLVVANRVDEGDRCLYYMEYYSHSEFKWTVEYYPNDKQVKCCCLMYESFGLPCCHMIAIMKYEHLLAIPPCLIMQRWTRIISTCQARGRTNDLLDEETLGDEETMGLRMRGAILKTVKRKNDAPTRRSKRLATCKAVSVSPETSTKIEIENGDGEGEGETNAEIEIEKEEGETVQLGSYKDRAVIKERIVALDELKHLQIPFVVNKCGLEPICTIQGSVNLHLVREFFAGIDGDTVDTVNMVLETVVSGKRIVVTPDNLARFCFGPNKDGKILLRHSADDFLILHHMFWWNVHPKPPRRVVDQEQAAMLFAVYNGKKPDVPSMWWESIHAAHSNDHLSASLPLGVLLTSLMTHYRIGKSENDTVEGQKYRLGRATIAKSKGQSKLHRKPKTLPLGSIEQSADMLCKIMEQESDLFDIMYSIEKRVKRIEKRQIRMGTVEGGEGKGLPGIGEGCTDMDVDDEADGDDDQEDEADDDGDDDDDQDELDDNDEEDGSDDDGVDDEDDDSDTGGEGQ